ncbi:MAG: hypothetical protein EPO11_11235, partial [Gammaproteobacteria bacterium]
MNSRNPTPKSTDNDDNVAQATSFCIKHIRFLFASVSKDPRLVNMIKNDAELMKLTLEFDAVFDKEPAHIYQVGAVDARKKTFRDAIYFLYHDCGDDIDFLKQTLSSCPELADFIANNATKLHACSRKFTLITAENQNVSKIIAFSPIHSLPSKE